MWRAVYFAIVFFLVLVKVGTILNFLKANLTCAKKINKVVCSCVFFQEKPFDRLLFTCLRYNRCWG